MATHDGGIHKKRSRETMGESSRTVSRLGRMMLLLGVGMAIKPGRQHNIRRGYQCTGGHVYYWGININIIYVLQQHACMHDAQTRFVKIHNFSSQYLSIVAQTTNVLAVHIAIIAFRQ